MVRLTIIQQRLESGIHNLCSLALCTVLGACGGPQPAPLSAPPTGSSNDLLLLSGYRSDKDPCKITGETASTNDFLDHTRDLVSCPENHEAIDVFLATHAAIEVARIDGYILFSVSRP
jgi:hypothetical protein